MAPNSFCTWPPRVRTCGLALVRHPSTGHRCSDVWWSSLQREYLGAAAGHWGATWPHAQHRLQNASGRASKGSTSWRLRAAAGSRPSEMVKAKEWSRDRVFLGRIFIDEKGPAIETAKSWGHRSTIWTDGSRLDSGGVGAACTWRSPEGWTGRRYHLGKNKEVFDAETCATLSALRIFDRRQESGSRFTIFADSTAAINRVRTDTVSPGQHLARAAIEVCSRMVSRNNEVTALWVLAPVGIAGNEEADRLAKEAAGGRTREVLDEYRWEASISHLSCV